VVAYKVCLDCPYATRSGESDLNLTSPTVFIDKGLAWMTGKSVKGKDVLELVAVTLAALAIGAGGRTGALWINRMAIRPPVAVHQAGMRGWTAVLTAPRSREVRLFATTRPSARPGVRLVRSACVDGGTGEDDPA
jgi:hypothetical protein